MSDSQIPDTLSSRLRSALHAFDLPSQCRTPTPADGVLISELPHLGYLILRAEPGDAAFQAAVAQALGVALPTQVARWTAGPGGVAYSVSPDEWWLLCSRARRDALVATLTTGLKGLHAQLVDNSGGHAAVRISGPQHLRLLRHLGAFDYESMQVGQAIGTVMSKANITVLRTDTQGVVLLFRRSFADYVWRLLTRTARPYGVCIAPIAAHADPVVSPLLTATPAPTAAISAPSPSAVVRTHSPAH